jgi:hypothetical protein
MRSDAILKGKRRSTPVIILFETLAHRPDNARIPEELAYREKDNISVPRCRLLIIEIQPDSRLVGNSSLGPLNVSTTEGLAPHTYIQPEIRLMTY